ncbi:MAG TPA: M1 family metallopeptidase, partial [Longimicrobiales bacterium]
SASAQEPNVYRSGSGRPGPQYWQQRVDYRIEATLDPAQNQLRGHEIISYLNNSPDTLRYLWLHVEQNICAPGSITNVLNQPPLVFGPSTFDFSCQGFVGGDSLESVMVGGRAARRMVDGTIMRVELPAPLPPRGSTSIDVAWRFKVPPYGAGRMGHDGPLYEIAQWYPRVAVYDDVRGWNHEPYIGAGEFYLEYGSFDVALHVPANFVVAATGRLLNPEDVLSAAQRERLARALTSETPVAIITAEELAKASATPSAAIKTWRFHADSVRDFAFAAAPNLRWDASGYNGILINTLYRSSAALWTESNKMARAAIKYFSDQWFPYPYPHATTIEGPIEGMEYPMLTFVPKGADRHDLQWVLMHEFGHEWFPMIVGSNERLYPWMDEGFNTFIDLGGAASYFSGTAYADTVGQIALHLYPEHAVVGKEQPLISRPIDVHDLFWVAYRKPSLMMSLLRSEVLGAERFDAAFREYIRAWAFKHPTPADFFRMMRDQSGLELDWFWRGWVFTTARLDQSVDAVAADTVMLSSNGDMIMPVELKLTFDNGTSEVVKLPVDMWNLGPHFEYRVRGSRKIVAAEVDPRHVLPDTNRGNDKWPR